MGGTRKFEGHRSQPQHRDGAGARILSFDSSRRPSRAAIARLPKQPERPKSRGSLIQRAISSIVAFLFGTSRGGRPVSRGAEPSGKRRA